MMIELLLDTHSLVWLLFGDARLPEKVRLLIDEVLQRGGRVGCSSITLVEMVYLIEKGKLNPDVWRRTTELIESPQAPLKEVPVMQEEHTM